MTNSYTVLRLTTQAITLFTVLMVICFPTLLGHEQLQMAAAITMLLGIPHGATDHLIFEQLSQPFLGAKGRWQFYGCYLALVVVYGLIWWTLPIVAFGVFLVMSAYHFGQSNWASVGVPFPNRSVAALTYWSSGCFVLFFPIVWHFDSAAPIISNIVGEKISALTAAWRTAICAGILVMNLGILFYWHWKGMIVKKQLLEEVLNLVLLSLLFATAPLLLGFVIYFVFWHSLGSVMDQIRFFQLKSKQYTWRIYARQALPMTLIAIGTLVSIVLLKDLLLLPSNLSLLFIFIAIITLPHMLLIEQLYEEWKKDDRWKALS